MEGDDGLRTVECLRGRLLAERQASRVATEDAQIMAKKLIQLENQLREETKLRIKAEKKLHFLMKKLGSLKMHLNSPGICGISCTSSTSTSCASSKDSFDSQITNSAISQEIKDDIGETSNSFQESATSADSTTKSEDPRLQLANGGDGE
ncbi:hypothetical protein HS088_TW13G00006 [Tripterygium wilfordii]|uniref:Uncharacterized protein n=1 Tax=Tripterygium wilfordii TaxID=458696 RepID=A0A7J7CT11_TRIWF|nr:uncharacterized protein LOC120013697 [Tripterygium wilfordii]KAF5737128.1 hypothetical protein HS088_TW13G00006 [Tripterygium wilfordii]